MTQNQTVAKQGVRAQQRNALERISTLEQDLGRFISAVQESFSNNEKNVGELVEVVSALVRTVGANEVAATLNEIRAENAAKQVEADKAALSTALENGELVTAPVVTPESLITGVERDAEGKDIAPGYLQLVFATIKPEYQTAFLARAVGDKIDTENGRSFEITGIYQAAAKQE